MKPDLSGSAIFQWAKERLRNTGVPGPSQPRDVDANYEFPEDPDSLSSTELGQLMLKFAAFQGFRMRQLGMLEGEQVALNAEYRLRVGAFGVDMREQLGGRPSADTVETAVLVSHPELEPLFKRLTELETVRAVLRRQIEMFAMQWQALSREQARRAELARSGG